MSIVHTTTVKPKVFCSHFVVSQISQQFEKYQLSLYLHILCLTGTWWNSQVWNEKFPQHSGGWVKHSDLARTHCSCKFFLLNANVFFAWIACIKIPPSLNLTFRMLPIFFFRTTLHTTKVRSGLRSHSLQNTPLNLPRSHLKPRSTTRTLMRRVRCVCPS